MSDLNVLMELLNTRILHRAVINDGDCFFHALEYALNRCPLVPEDKKELTAEEKYPFIKRSTYKDTRTQVSQQLKDNYEVKLVELISLIESNETNLSNTRSDTLKEIDNLNKLIQEMTAFEKGQQYATEEVIYQTAIHKGKILLIVQESPNPYISLIHPNGIPLTKKNVIVLLRSSHQEHYNTFAYPLTIKKEFLRMLSRFESNTETVFEVEGVTLKDATLNRVLSFYNETKLKEIKEKISIRQQIASNELFARKLQAKNETRRNSRTESKRNTPRNLPANHSKTKNMNNTFIHELIQDFKPVSKPISLPNTKRMQREKASRNAKSRKERENRLRELEPESPKTSPTPSPRDTLPKTLHKSSPKTRKWMNPLRWMNPLKWMNPRTQTSSKRTSRVPRRVHSLNLPPTH